MTGEESLCAAAAALGPTEPRLPVLKTVSTFAFTLMAATIPASWNLAAAPQSTATDRTESPSTPDAAPAATRAGTATPAAGGPPGQPTATPAEAAPAAADPSGATADRTQLNLLGQVDSASGESRRNENVRLALIDNNLLSELNTRMGTTATIVKDFKVDQDYWATEFGGRPKPALHLPPVRANQVHGNIFWSHDNSIFRARKFFHVGEVLPARRNNYGFTLSLPLWKGAAWTVNGSEGKDRGQENGNVQVLAADERTPLTNDPRIRPVVERIIATYPDELPNRGGRTLNTNAAQDINNDRIGGTLDQALGDNNRLTFRYNFVWQRVEAFQLVAGQAPDTTTRNHQARITWNRNWTPNTTSDFTIGFDRVGSLLVPDERSFGAWIRIGSELASLGPPGRYPVDRAQNRFRYAGRLRHVRGKHNLTSGFEVNRRHVNGGEVLQHRGLFNFQRNFGNDAVTNLRLGRPTRYTVAIGDVHRGFRKWFSQFYIGDDWKATSKLTLSMGLRWEPVTRPTEVNNLTNVPYSSDLNNFAPRFGFAYRLPEDWGVLRGAYGVHYGEIFIATYIQARINPPQNLTVEVDQPDLADPLKDLSLADLDPNARSSTFDLAPDMSTPYSHTYNFSWELTLAKDWTLELGYLGSRTHKLLAMWHLNRARPVPGIPLITRTINDRRPDQRFFEVRHVTNGSRAYFDAGKVTLRTRRRAGLNIEASYSFSKAIDLGGSYLNTAANQNRLRTDSPTALDNHNELRGVSNFDAPHAMLWNVSYQTSQFARRPRWLQGMFGRWQLSTVFLAKAGTPFSVQSGSDAPHLGNVDGRQSDNPVLLDPSVLGNSVDHPDTAAAQLPRPAFAYIPLGTPRGNLGRNTFRRDGIFNINMGLSKRWAISGDDALLFRAEALNVFNHPHFASPGSSLAARNFTLIDNTLNDGRTFKFTLRFSF